MLFYLILMVFCQVVSIALCILPQTVSAAWTPYVINAIQMIALIFTYNYSKDSRKEAKEQRGDYGSGYIDAEKYRYEWRNWSKKGYNSLFSALQLCQLFVIARITSSFIIAKIQLHPLDVIFFMTWALVTTLFYLFRYKKIEASLKH